MDVPRRLGAAVLVATSLVVGCSAEETRPRLIQADTTTTSADAQPRARAIGRTPASEPVRVLTEPSATAFRTIVATARVEKVPVATTVGGETSVELDNPTVSGGPLVFVVDELGDEWHRVLLPVGPPDRRGWIPADAVDLAAHDYRIEVDTASFELRVYDRTVVVFTASIGLDPDDLPEPGSVVYITELLQSAEPNPVYGTYAYGLSGAADDFTTFTGGPGQFGIHGTTDPESVGVVDPAGSIRLGTDRIEALVGFLPLGVPVEVV